MSLNDSDFDVIPCMLYCLKPNFDVNRFFLQCNLVIDDSVSVIVFSPAQENVVLISGWDGQVLVLCMYVPLGTYRWQAQGQS